MELPAAAIVGIAGLFLTIGVAVAPFIYQRWQRRYAQRRSWPVRNPEQGYSIRPAMTEQDSWLFAPPQPLLQNNVHEPENVMVYMIACRTVTSAIRVFTSYRTEEEEEWNGRSFNRRTPAEK